MTTIDNNWDEHFDREITGIHCLRIISPFISDSMAKRLLSKWKTADIKLITRYNLNDFRARASSTKALRRLVEHGVEIKGIEGLHSKVYVFDSKCAIITSANFTNGGFFNNKEFGVITHNNIWVQESLSYFDSLWQVDDKFLCVAMIDEWDKELAAAGKSSALPHLKDYGTSPLRKKLGGKNYFVKFFGSSDRRTSPAGTVRDQVSGTHCHFAVTFPKRKDSRRPRQYKDGDVVFVARMLDNKDYAIFGRTIAIEHNDSRDIASPIDISLAPYKKDFPIYIRVHSGEFLDTTLQNCPQLLKLMDDLEEESFASTKRNAINGDGNTIPRMSLMQKPGIKLSEEGAYWLERKFEEAKECYSTIPDYFIKTLHQG